ncbi:EthD family reductase [Nocardia xishanensis]|uniref:EthD family reductase n=1 Tax=Nocardia xishanensis TaxID=238964 RepID=UPI00342BE42F
MRRFTRGTAGPHGDRAHPRDIPNDPEAFDRHYHEVHIPLARRLPKVRRYALGCGVTPVRGDRSYYCVAEHKWDSMPLPLAR